MTQAAEKTGVPPTEDQTTVIPRNLRSWWHRPWMIPLAIIVIAFLTYVWPPYLTLDPQQARIVDLRSDRFPLHYPFVVAHIAFGTVAMVTACLQVWPKLRIHRPAVHRIIGRISIFAGILPAGLLALMIMPFSGGPPGDAVAAIMWLGFTAAGFRMVRKRRFAEHRRFMIYSFAMTMQIIWARAMFFVIPLFPGYDDDARKVALETSTWLGFVINLIIAQWWLERTSRKTRRRRASVLGG